MKGVIVTMMVLICIEKKFACLETVERWNCKRDCERIKGFYPSGHNIQWPSAEIKKCVISKGNYNPKDIIPTRMQFYDEFVYITFPKYRKGVPFSLGRMSLRDRDRSNPLIMPYPRWRSHDDTCKTPIRNAVDIYLDSSQILWVLDTGIVNLLETPNVTGTAQVIGIEVKSNKIKHKFELEGLTCKNSKLQFIISEVIKNETTLYISDAGTRALITYDLSMHMGFRYILPHVMKEGVTNADVMYLAISNKAYGRKPTILLTYLESKFLCWLNTEDIRLKKKIDYASKVNVKPAKIVILGSDDVFHIYFRFMGDNAVYRWGVQDPLKFPYFVYINRPNSCRMATHVAPGNGNLMWVLESNIQDYLNNQAGSLGPSAKIYPLVQFCESR